MIYISTSCIKSDNIIESVLKLKDIGVNNIELSGGTKYYEKIEQDLLEIKEKYNLKFQCHNYFPPPKKPFVINLASTDLNILNKSISNIKEALLLSNKLGANKFGFHAGFYFNPIINQLGKVITPTKLEDKYRVTNQFIKVFNELKSIEPNVTLYIENNVLSAKNYQNFGCNPFMLTNSKEYDDLILDLDFKLLLDVAHLKVTCQTLGLNFNNEFKYLIKKADYIHISDNDGLNDENKGLKKNGILHNLLKEIDLKKKTITLEVYDGIKSLDNTINIINELL